MQSKHALVPNNPRRLPRKGFLFALARFASLLLEVAGMLLLGIAGIGFFLMLVRIGPTFVGAVPNLNQKMGGFIFLVSLGYLLIFPIVGLVGTTMAGIGFALGFVGTQRRVSIDDQIGQITDDSAKEPAMKRAG